MTNDNKQQKHSDSTCDAQPFDSVIHSDFLNNKYQPLK
jgi:hypothetical protein